MQLWKENKWHQRLQKKHRYNFLFQGRKSVNITTDMVKTLREKTNAGMMDCKKALKEAKGNLEKANEILRKKGLLVAAKKAGRETKQGIIGSYIHTNSKIGVLVEVNCETDFVAKNDIFRKFVKNLTLQITSANPLYVSKDDIPPETIEKEKEIFKAQIKGKPDNIVEKIVNGKIDKWYSEVCLLNQPFVKDPDKTTIQDLLTAKIAELGENIAIKRFVRYHVGE